MRTLLLLATAATVAWMAQDAQAQTRTERRVVVVQPQHGAPDDAEVYRSGDDRALNERDYRGRWVEGVWTPDRRRFEGVYEVDDRAGPPPRGPMRMDHHRGERRGADFDGPRDSYDRDGGWDDEEMMRRCNRRGGGATGAVAGGVLGGVAGNRLGRRGNRGVGTAVGTVAGAVAGAVIERAVNNRGCDDWYRDYQARSSRGSYERYDEGAYDQGYSYGGMQTIVIPGQPVIIEETETTYETVVVEQARPRVRHRAAPRRVVHRPRPRPRCTCR
jgi:uncharacterized protein YcfJ